MNMSLVLRLPRKMHVRRSSSNAAGLPTLFKLLQKPRVLLTFDKVHNPLRLPLKTISERLKVLRPRQFLTPLTSKCASHIFAPQRRALVQHLNFQKCSENVVFCTFWSILTSKCASRHKGVQFLISHLARWLRTRRFSEPTFQPSGATNHLKNTVIRDFPTFSRTCIFFLLTLSSDSFFSSLSSDSFFWLFLFSFSSLSLLLSSLLLSCLLFSSLALPTSAFSSVNNVGSLTSKLPSISIYKYILLRLVYNYTVYIYIVCAHAHMHWDWDGRLEHRSSMSIEPRPESVEECFATQKGSTNYDGGNPRDCTNVSGCCQRTSILFLSIKDRPPWITNSSISSTCSMGVLTWQHNGAGERRGLPTPKRLAIQV